MLYGYRCGIMNSVRSYVNNVPGTVYWQARGDATNARGQYTDEEFGNGLHMKSEFDRIAGWIDSRKTGPVSGSETAVQNLQYEWYKTGNMKLRRDANRSLSETFTYDPLDRLDKVFLNSAETLDVNYDAIGNIQFKSDVGTYAYGHPVHEHAVTSISPVSGQSARAFTYDKNGNMDSRDGVSTTWFSYNLPKKISESASTWSEFSYTFSRDRWKQEISNGGSLETMTYIGDLFEKRVVGANVEYRHQVIGGSGAVAYVERGTGGDATYYVSTDHLGGTSVITDASGNVVVNESFDVFGQRRNGVTWSGVPTVGDMTQIATSTRRGFTSHEHLDNLKLIHMNGRVFDPKIGRFTSADPFVQDPFDGQSLNRYSYVFNNPLKYTDPSGFFGVCLNIGPGGGANPDDDGWGMDMGFCDMPFTTPVYSYPVGGGYATTAEWTKPGADSSVDRFVPVGFSAIDPMQLARMFLGTDAGYALLKYLQTRQSADFGVWEGNVTFGGEFGRLRPDLIYVREFTRIQVYEIKPFGSDDAAKADLGIYLRKRP